MERPADHPMRILGRRLETLRRRQGLTYRDVETRTGMSRSTLQYLFRRRSSAPDYHVLTALVDRLGGSWDDEWEVLWHQAADAEPGDDGRTSAPAAAGPVPVVRPAQLPPDVRAFGGRAVELTALDELLLERRSAGALVVAAVSGTAGVGKTALAVHWAHRVHSAFPDGQLYVDLHGYGPEQPLRAVDVLGRMLAAVGVASSELPPDGDQRAGLYRTLLDGRRMLIVLDNAASSEQVRLLLPGSPTCLVLVTSRNSLVRLVAVHGARRIKLNPLPQRDAVALLGTLIGPRVATEPDAAGALADRCDRLPLALRVAAELAAARPGIPLSDLVSELADERRRLDLLDVDGDPRSGVRAVLSWSYRHLDGEAARAFRLLGLLPGHDIDTYGIAALVGTDLDTARVLAARLAHASLVHPVGTGRYGMHNLLWSYARLLASESDPQQVQRFAMARLASYQLAAAGAAGDALFGAATHQDDDQQATDSPSDRPMPAFVSSADALAWLDSERPALTAGSRLAVADGRSRDAIALSRLLSRYLNIGGHHSEALVVHGNACAAAEATGDVPAEAEALADLGATWAGQGRFTEAAAQLQRALALRQQLKDRGGQAAILSSLGAVHAAIGTFDVAAEQLERALVLFTELDDPAGEARVRSNLSGVAVARRRHTEAGEQLERALALFRKAGDESGAARVLSNLGDVRAGQGRIDEGARQLEEALALFRRTGDRVGEAHTIRGIADLLVRQGRGREATDRYERALALFQDIGDQAEEARTTHALEAAKSSAEH